MRRPWVLLSIAVFLLLVFLAGFKWWKDRRNERRLAHLSGLLSLDLDEYEKRTWKRSPPFGEPVDGEFLDLLQTAADLAEIVDDAVFSGPTDVMTEDTGALDELDELDARGFPERMTPGLVGWIGRREEVLAAVLEAVRADTVGPWTDVRDVFGDAGTVSSNPIGAILGPSPLLRVDALRQAEAGRPDLAAERILALARLGANCELGAGPLRTVLGGSLRVEAARAALDLAGRGHFDAAARARLAAWADRCLGETMDLAGLVGTELLTIQVMLRAMARGDVDWSIMRPPPSGILSKARELIPEDPAKWLDVWEGVRRWTPRIRAAAERGYDDLLAEWVRMVENLDEPGLDPQATVYIILRERLEENRVVIQALAVALRLCDHRDRHGAWPASLDGLDPPALDGRKWVYVLDPETKKPTLDVDPPLDEDDEERVPLFRVR